MSIDKVNQQHQLERDESTKQSAIDKHTDSWIVPESESIKLQRAYEAGLINQADFLKQLFNSEEADRVRRKIVGG